MEETIEALNDLVVSRKVRALGASKPSYLDDAAGALNVKLTDEDIAFLEEPYIPHRIVGAIDRNPAEGTILLDEKK